MVEVACIEFLHPSSSVIYDEFALYAREDHACAFRWLAKLYSEGHELAPVSHFYLGRAFSRGECGAPVDLSLAEHFLYLVISGSHDHAFCSSYSDMLMCQRCIASGAAHEELVARAMDEMIRIYSGGLRWHGWPERLRALLSAQAKRPDATPSAQFNYGEQTLPEPHAITIHPTIHLPKSVCVVLRGMFRPLHTLSPDRCVPHCPYRAALPPWTDGAERFFQGMPLL